MINILHFLKIHQLHIIIRITDTVLRQFVYARKSVDQEYSLSQKLFSLVLRVNIENLRSEDNIYIFSENLYIR